MTSLVSPVLALLLLRHLAALLAQNLVCVSHSYRRGGALEDSIVPRIGLGRVGDRPYLRPWLLVTETLLVVNR